MQPALKPHLSAGAAALGKIPKISYSFDAPGGQYSDAVEMSNFIRTRPHTRMLRWHIAEVQADRSDDAGETTAHAAATSAASDPSEVFVNAGSATRVLGRQYDAAMFARNWDADSLRSLVASFNAEQGSKPAWRYEVHPAHYEWDHVLPAGRPQDTELRTDLGHRIISSNPAEALKFEALLSATHVGANGLSGIEGVEVQQLEKHTGVEFPYNSGRLVSHSVYGRLVDDRAKSNTVELLANLEQVCAALEVTANRLETIYAAEGNKTGLGDLEVFREQLVVSREVVATAQGLTTTLWVPDVNCDEPSGDADRRVERSRP